MNGYIDRLMTCGIPYKKACEIYSDYVRNFSVADLEIYVKYMETKIHVD